MQDYPKLLDAPSGVGFTNYPTWYCFSPAKNNLKDAAACVAKGIPPYAPSSAEWDFYDWTNKMLIKAGVNVELQQEKQDYEGVSLAFGPKVLVHPSFALTF